MFNLLVVAAYAAFLIGIGIRKSAHVHGQASFSLAGRGLGTGVLVGTLVATWTGTGSIFGQAERSWEVGLPALILPLGSVFGFAVLFVLCTRVRRHGPYTLQDILEERFGPVARVLGTLTLLLAYLVIVSYQFRAATVVLERLFADVGWSDGPGAGHGLSLVVVALLVGGYTALAGMLSISLTDTFNGVLMTIGLVLALPFVWSAAGGAEAVVAALPESGRRVTGLYGAFDLLSYTLPTFLLVMGDANLHTRFLSARSDGVARRAALLLIPAVLFVDGAIIMLAVGGRALMPDLEAGGHVIFELALTHTPPVIGALLVATILAVIVSTADSYLLSSSSALLRDVYQRFVSPQADDRQLLRVARLLVMLCTLVALGMAFLGEGFFEVAFFAYTVYGVGITPVLLAALFWRRATPVGAIGGMLAGMTTVIVWEALSLSTWAAALLGQPEGTVVEAVIPAILVASAVLTALSLVTKPRPGPAAGS
ncbi:MAG: sodium:solute symporter family protein [Planctomycetota bacterium]|jgi:Na+/proline symporter